MSEPAGDRPPQRKPDWLRVRLPSGEAVARLGHLLRDKQLVTVCEEARCPNMHECWSQGTATFMILGDTCTRSCGFCNVKTGRPGTVDWDEAERVAEAAAQMGLRHVVITSVDRDELPDKGAGLFALTIRKVRRALPEATIEVLIPDFRGEAACLRLVLAEKPDVLNHNVETIARLYPTVRPQAVYAQSLELIRRAARAGFFTKSGFMVGLGESDEEVEGLIRDLVEHEARFITIGQYLQPTKRHLPVARYVHPDRFLAWARYARSIGVERVQAGPLVRSSYHAGEELAAEGDVSVQRGHAFG